MKAYTYTEADLTGFANQVIGEYLRQLNNSNCITDEKSKELIQYQVIVTTKNLFSKYWDRLWKVEESELRMVMVKVVDTDTYKEEL